ncbi:MAG TPA: GPW/gp25 family protein [Thermoanaerobaculia bacterium]|nr:GPW/gp25 family protein [Thermoanaerobaculia bacterium]
MADDAHLGTDLRIELGRQEWRPVYAVATELRRVPGRAYRLEDLASVSGRGNLGQAVLARLLTPRGELTALGHPEYGSRLHELVGRTNTATTRNLVKLYVLETLEREPRIDKVLRVVVEPSPVRRDLVEVLIELLPARLGPLDTLTIGPLALELEP